MIPIIAREEIRQRPVGKQVQVTSGNVTAWKRQRRVDMIDDRTNMD
jgi:hypothetical protein